MTRDIIVRPTDGISRREEDFKIELPEDPNRVMPDFSDRETAREYSPKFFNGLSDLEGRLFEERGEGKFLVFAPSVLGVDRIYKMSNGFSLTFSKRQARYKETCSGITPLLLPDPGIMRLLQKQLGDRFFRQLEAFYTELCELSSYESMDIQFYPDLTINTKVSHDFTNIPVYYNGARFPKNSRQLLQNKDVIRIGESILFAYIEKSRGESKHF